MDAEVSWFQGHLLHMDEAECWDLLRVREVGRVAFVDGDGPMVVPITYIVDDDAVLFRVAPYSSLAQSLRGSAVALEVDDIDYFTRSGWNVVVRGRADIVDTEDLPREATRPTPWAAGQRTMYLRVAPSSVSGRRLLEA
jgi:nitroimidazol reductase NimA-like FMN-containing flavoprotein (pyridoxamine 5'-phosphate oxidase superfamily)